MYMLKDEEISHCSFELYYEVVICHCLDFVAWRLSMYLKISFKVWLFTYDPMVGCQWKNLRTHPIMLKHKIAPFCVLSFILHMKEELKKLCWEEETLREKIELVNWKAFVGLPHKKTFCVFVKKIVCSPKLPNLEILGVYVYLAITMLWVSSSFSNRFFNFLTTLKTIFLPLVGVLNKEKTGGKEVFFSFFFVENQ